MCIIVSHRFIGRRHFFGTRRFLPFADWSGLCSAGCACVGRGGVALYEEGLGPDGCGDGCQSKEGNCFS